MNLDIEWLHKEHKEGRRSGRTTEMLANAVGVALVADTDTDIYIICGLGNEMNIWTHFIEVLRAVAPTTTYFRNIHDNRPCITIPLNENIVRVIFRHDSPIYAPWSHMDESRSPFDEYWFFDHYYGEIEEMERVENDTFNFLYGNGIFI